MELLDVYAAAKVGIEISSPPGYNYAILLPCELITETLVTDTVPVLWLSYPPVTAITRRYIIRSPFVDDRRRRTERMNVQATITLRWPCLFAAVTGAWPSEDLEPRCTCISSVMAIYIQVHDCNHDLRFCRTLRCAAYISFKSITERIAQIIDVESTLNLTDAHVLQIISFVL